MTVNIAPSILIWPPTSAGSPPKRDRQKPSLRTTEVGAAVSSAATNVRPAIGFTPRTSKKRGVTACPGTLSAAPSAAVSARGLCRKAAIDSKLRVRSLQSAKSAGLTEIRGVSFRRSHTAISRSGAVNGSGRSSVASASAKIALLAPIPSASVSTATSANPGAAFICRAANRTSSRHSSSHCVMRILRSRFLPMSTQVRVSRLRSPNRAIAISRATFGSTPRSISSCVRIST